MGTFDHYGETLAGSQEDGAIFRTLIVSGQRVRLRHPWSTAGSAIVQALFLATVAIIPLYNIPPLPKREWPTAVLLEAPPKVVVTAPIIRQPKVATSRAASRAPVPVPIRKSEPVAPVPVLTATESTPGTASGSVEGVSGAGTFGPRAVPVPEKEPEPAPPKRIRVASGVAEANLIHDVPPQYPAEAGRERIEGTVVLMAVIGTDGTVKDVQVESGPPLLISAAIEAVRQWRYKPYLLNGTPVEIDSRITINFTMARG